ncbi:MAG: response regulator transcription factor [Chloroflexota bacterium]|nr:response regulator transcription factor [Chloroflexota bacterium]
MKESPIRILVVDDHRIVREGINSLMEDIEYIQVVGEASNGYEGVALVDSLNPDVVLMDLMMPRMDGLEATRLITEKHPHIRVLVLTSFIADEKVFPAIKAGAMGYLLKDTGSKELIDAIRMVHRGEPSLGPEIAKKVLNEIHQPAAYVRLTPDPLTERELQVLKVVAQGKSNKEIAAALHISVHTVRTHVNRILSKLHLANRVQATLYALREGISSNEETGA